MTLKNNLNNAIISAVEKDNSSIEPEMVEEYYKLKEKCEKVITKIKTRKSKSSPPIVIQK